MLFTKLSKKNQSIQFTLTQTGPNVYFIDSIKGNTITYHAAGCQPNTHSATINALFMQVNTFLDKN